MSTEEDIAAFVAARQAEAKAVADGLFFACRNPDRVPDFTGAGGPAAAEFWDHFTPGYVLAEIEHTRALIVRIRATPHHDLPSDERDPCPATLGDGCECGRDARVGGMLAVIAGRWDAHPEFKAEGKP